MCLFDSRLHHHKTHIKGSQYFDLENLINQKRASKVEKMRIQEFLKKVEIRQSFQITNNTISEEPSTFNDIMTDNSEYVPKVEHHEEPEENLDEDQME